MDNKNIPKTAAGESQLSGPNLGLSSSSIPEPVIRQRRRRTAPIGASSDCFSCQKRRVHCDRKRPYCTQCLDLGKDCSGYKTTLTWGVGVASRGKLRGLSLPIANWSNTASGPVPIPSIKASEPDVELKVEENNFHYGYSARPNAAAGSRFPSPLSLGVPSLGVPSLSSTPSTASTDFDGLPGYCDTCGSPAPAISIQSPRAYPYPQSSCSPSIFSNPSFFDEFVLLPGIPDESPRGGDGTSLLRYSTDGNESTEDTADGISYPNSYIQSELFSQRDVSMEMEPAASAPSCSQKHATSAFLGNYPEINSMSYQRLQEGYGHGNGNSLSHSYPPTHSNPYPGSSGHNPTEPIHGEHMVDSSGNNEPHYSEHGHNGRVFSTWSNLPLQQREEYSLAMTLRCPKCRAVFVPKAALLQEQHKRHDAPSTNDFFELPKQRNGQTGKEDPMVKQKLGHLRPREITPGREIPQVLGGVGVPLPKSDQSETICGLNHSEPDSVKSSPRLTSSTSSSSAVNTNSPATEFTISSYSDGTSTASTESVDQKEAIIRRLMADLHRIISRNQMAGSLQQDQMADQESPRSSESREKLPVEERKGTKRSRSSVQNDQRQGDEAEPNENEDDEDFLRRKRQRTEIKDGDGSLRLACPYFKRDPRKYRNWRSCSGPGWPSVHRVKEHLYRCHKLPIQCPRCCVTFKSESLLVEHQRQDLPCDRRDALKMEGFDKTQEARLKSRKKDKDATTEAEKWNTIYRILFPDDDPNRLPSPYFDEACFKQLSMDDNQESDWTQYESFLQRELPASFRRELESRLDRLWSSAEQDMRQQIPEIFQEMQIRLYQEFKRTRSETCSSSQSLSMADESAPQPPNLEQWQLPNSLESAVDGSSALSDGSIPIEFEGIRYELEPHDFALFSSQGSEDMVFDQFDYQL